MIGSDPRYQAIINAYKAGEYNAPYQSIDYTPSPYYNPIYDIRREQIKAGELEEGARFPKPQLMTTPETPLASPETPIDPCPPGYQLVDGVCQPDTMFQQDRGGNDKETYTGPKITDGIIEGYEEVIPSGLGPESGALNSMMMMELEKRFGPEIASQMGELNRKYGYRGVQYNPTTGNFVAKSPTFGQMMGDVGGAFGSMFSGAGEAVKNYLSSGGLLGTILSPFISKQPTVNYGGSSDISVSTQPMITTDSVIPTGIVRPGYPVVEPTVPTGINRPGYTLPQPKIEITFPSQEDKKPTPTPKKGTGESGPPGRNYSTPARTRAAQAASRLGTTLATRGR